MARVFSHLTLVLSFLLPLIGSSPSVPVPVSLGPEHDHFYQATVDRWKKSMLSSQPASLSFGSVPKFFCRMSAAGTLTHVEEFALDMILSKMTTPSGVRPPSLEVNKSDFAADVLSVQNLLLFHKDYVGKFKSAPPQHNPKMS